MKNKKILFGISGSFCNHHHILKQLQKLCKHNEVKVVVSDHVYHDSTRFFNREDFLKQLEDITKQSVMHTIVQAETVGPDNIYDFMVIAPMTATLCARICHGIYDHPVALAAKAMIRNQKNVIVGIASNDVLGASAANFFSLIDRKYIYVIPFRQDAPHSKAYSVVADWELLEKTCELALKNKQIQPILLGEAYV